MNNILKTHLLNDYVVKMHLLGDGLYRLTYPANNKLGLSAKEVEFKLDDFGIEVSCGGLLKRIEAEAPIRIAFILMYTSLENVLRKMDTKLFCIFDVKNNEKSC